ncbi:UDP-4-amino-4,6-dideoxy-N-acetyl-beta-L-altrosamine transaminase [Ekhidna sp.]
MKKRSIPYGKQQITDQDVKAVVEALTSDFLTQGPRIKEFEVEFAKYVESDFAVAVSNGTAALHLSALSLDLRPGQKVITSPITFSASANCIQYCGAEVVFVDIDPETYLLDLDKVTELLKKSSENEFVGIIPVDLAGRAVDLQRLREIADEYSLWIIEDSCHAPGGFFVDNQSKKQFCGNGSFADMSIFSFHPVKHIAAGEGGMITTNDEKLYNRLLDLRTHGITKNPNRFVNEQSLAVGKQHTSPDWPEWYMEMQELGYNYRLTDFQAALGQSQLKRADEGVAKRREIAAQYYKSFEGKSFILGQSGIVYGHAYHLYVIEVNDRLGLYNYLRTKDIYCQIHYIPVHLMPYYGKLGWKKGDLPHAENYYKSCLSLPMFPSLTEEEQAFVIDTICKYYNE